MCDRCLSLWKRPCRLLLALGSAHSYSWHQGGQAGSSNQSWCHEWQCQSGRSTKCSSCARYSRQLATSWCLHSWNQCFHGSTRHRALTWGAWRACSGFHCSWHFRFQCMWSDRYQQDHSWPWGKAWNPSQLHCHFTCCTRHSRRSQKVPKRPWGQCYPSEAELGTFLVKLRGYSWIS